MPERVFPADEGMLDDVLAFTEEQLEAAECPVKLVMPLTVAIEDVRPMQVSAGARSRQSIAEESPALLMIKLQVES